MDGLIPARDISGRRHTTIGEPASDVRHLMMRQS